MVKLASHHRHSEKTHDYLTKPRKFNHLGHTPQRLVELSSFHRHIRKTHDYLTKLKKINHFRHLPVILYY